MRLEEIDQAVNKFQPVTPDHAFYVDFKDLRGEFQEKLVMNALNVRRKNNAYVFDDAANKTNKTLLFLAGMRGSGKTSELAKYARLIHSPQCFFVVTCNVDLELDMDNVQYMDILIFQLEKLLQKAAEVDLDFDDSILNSMRKWFHDRVLEINKTFALSGGLEVETGIGQDETPISVKGILGKLLGITAKLKAELSGNYERAETIRETFQRRFNDFALKFNTFIEQTNDQLRREGKAREVLFIVDGLEKTLSAETRQKIILLESNRLRQIKANTLFTLPIELMKEEQKIKKFADEVISFPFVKIIERDGTPVPEAIKRFEEFVQKRIDTALFDSQETIRFAIQFSGGSPRQLLNILEQAAWQVDDSQTVINRTNVEKAVQKLGNSYARYLEPEQWQKLADIKRMLEKGQDIGFDPVIQDLLEKEIIFEYNDGTYKRVNPLLTVSKMYGQHVAHPS